MDELKVFSSLLFYLHIIFINIQQKFQKKMKKT